MSELHELLARINQSTVSRDALVGAALGASFSMAKNKSDLQSMALHAGAGAVLGGFISLLNAPEEISADSTGEDRIDQPSGSR